MWASLFCIYCKYLHRYVRVYFFGETMHTGGTGKRRWIFIPYLLAEYCLTLDYFVGCASLVVMFDIICSEMEWSGCKVFKNLMAFFQRQSQGDSSFCVTRATESNDSRSNIGSSSTNSAVNTDYSSCTSVCIYTSSHIICTNLYW